jgi:hypothetical protein
MRNVVGALLAVRFDRLKEFVERKPGVTIVDPYSSKEMAGPQHELVPVRVQPIDQRVGLG